MWRASDSPVRRVDGINNRGKKADSRSGSPVAVSGGYAALPQCGQHRGVGDVQVSADSCQRPAEVVEADRLVDLLSGESSATHRHAVPMEDGADRSPLDAELVAQFIHGGSGHVPGDEFPDTVGVELACPPWFGSADGGRWGRARQLPEQCLQRFYLRSRVVVSSPKVHFLALTRAYAPSAVLIDRCFSIFPLVTGYFCVLGRV
jgi:hypothetical protein